MPAHNIAQPQPPRQIADTARKPIITEVFLRSLGPKRLAAFLLEARDRDEVIDWKVRLALAAKGGGDTLDTELTSSSSRPARRASGRR